MSTHKRNKKKMSKDLFSKQSGTQEMNNSYLYCCHPREVSFVFGIEGEETMFSVTEQSSITSQSNTDCRHFVSNRKGKSNLVVVSFSFDFSWMVPEKKKLPAPPKMSTGHTHLGGPHMTQNQGNVLGDRPCVRQSRLYREQVGGNVMKDILGQQTLKWDTNRTEGAYKGGRVFDHINQQYETGPRQTKPRYDDGVVGSSNSASSPLQSKAVNRATDVFSTKPSTEAPPAPTGRRGGANASRQTYNVITGQ